MGKNESFIIGVCSTALYKCEEEECGKLFITSVDYLFPVEGLQTANGETPPMHVEVHCPAGHEKVKFIQSIDKRDITADS